MEFEKITELIQAVSKSDLTNFYMEEGNLKISMKAGKKAKVKGLQTAPVIVQGAENFTEQEEVLSQKSAPQGKTIKSPLVGTFYNAPSPGAKVFVQEGDTVKKGQVLGIIEAMKLMNEIEAEEDGVIEKILVSNETMVEYGQPLFVLGQE
ncbi:acetyl-CoA carboxylase biotin carboxyl carrier protein [Blautia argi]|uniref:acetyl-CoA carboxylase biotin carboxyl carrier protein n=1 Tax=Blautia argi TaxID=1912897 RepID=UPI002941FB3E|nr:acetyl-CoA carboxylase biotin carboxyl carrier protein [Blautia argi]